MATEPQPAAPVRSGSTQQSAPTQSAEDIMKLRRQAGSIAEVIEPVQRTRMENTNQ